MSKKEQMKDFKTCLKGLWHMMSGQVILRSSVSVLLGALRIATSLGFVWICKRLVDVATHISDASISQSVAIMIAIVLTRIAISIGTTYWARYNTVKTQNMLRASYFNHVLNARWNGREEFRSGDTVNRLEEDIRFLTDVICDLIPGVIVTICQLIASSIYLLCMAPSLLWLVLLMTGVAVGCSKLNFKKIRQLTKDIRSDDSEVQQLIQENLQNRVLVLTLFGVDNVMSRLGGIQRHLESKYISRLNYNAVARGFMGLGFSGGYAAAFLWGVAGLHHGTVTYGMMTSFLQLVGQVQGPIADLANQVPAFIKALTSIERLLELDDMETEDPKEDIVLEGAPGIRVEEVTFAYDGTNILEGFSHDFKPGSITVLAGPTGVGKSTLTRLLLGLLRPQQGKVSLYQGSESHPAGVDTRCNFMYVPQGNTLLSGTIRENMLLAKPGATDEEIGVALKTAAAEFVFGLENGLDTLCGESGSGLSEGQSQRIAVARALLHEGGIMILDEATSALDLETEERLLSNIREHCKGGKTVVFISHRPAASAIADDVINLSRSSL